MNILAKEIKRSLFCGKTESVRINICYPFLKDKKRYAAVINGFYKKTAESFLKFAETALATFAAKHISDVLFEPAAAVMKARVVYEDTRFALISMEISVYDGLGNIKRVCKQNMWNKKLGVAVPQRAVPKHIRDATQPF